MKTLLLQTVADRINSSGFRVNGVKARSFSRPRISGIVWSEHTPDGEQHAIAYYHGGKFHVSTRYNLLPRNCPAAVIARLNSLLETVKILQAA